MAPCTSFCTALSTVCLTDGQLPSHEQLLQQLPAAGEVNDWYLGTWYEIQQRTQCKICQFVVAAIIESVQHIPSDKIVPSQRIDVALVMREQSFRLLYPSPLGTRLAFMAKDNPQAQGPDTARCIAAKDSIIPRIKGWLEICDTRHDKCLLSDNRPTMFADQHIDSPTLRHEVAIHKEFCSNFRLIDLELGCIRSAPPDARYVALSYVWGQTPMLKLQLDNYDELASEGCLKNIRNALPRTINNAIDLLTSLGERYLWVDGLCLVQDDADDVARGISMMQAIYSGSYLTIVAASGHEAGAGLPALARNTHIHSPSEHVAHLASGLTLTMLHSIDWHLQRSVYNQRGWTLQELVLPRRTLIFINEQVYFRCQAANWAEETCADHWDHWLDNDDCNIIRIPDPSEGFSASCWAYQKLCEDFSRRTLRNEGDALRALSGIIQPTARGMQTPIIEGLPAYFLDHFLLFISSRGDMRRRDRFASFSWAGWEGAIMWPRENFEWSRDGEESDVQSRREMANLSQYLKHSRLVAWRSQDLTARIECLTREAVQHPLTVLEFASKRPYIAPTQDPDPSSMMGWWGSQYRLCAHTHPQVPDWDDDSKIPPSSEQVLQSPELFRTKTVNAVNSWAEYERLLKRIEHQGIRSANSNMGIASLCQYTLLDAMTTEKRPPWERIDRCTALGDFRHPREHYADKAMDRSMYPWRLMDLRTTVIPDNYDDYDNYDDDDDDANIPAFPPYTTLQFTTISLHLELGHQTKTIDPESLKLPFDRIPGIPLLSKSRSIVGSLHPDNLALLPEAGSHIELLLVSHSFKLAAESALLGLDGGNARELFWVLYVVWEEGVAERRGVGQIVEEALEGAVGGGSGVRRVVLG